MTGENRMDDKVAGFYKAAREHLKNPSTSQTDEQDTLKATPSPADAGISELVASLRNHMIWPQPSMGVDFAAFSDPLAAQAADAIADLTAQLTAAQQRVAEMREALRVYGDHSRKCADDIRDKCTCGFDAVRSSLIVKDAK